VQAGQVRPAPSESLWARITPKATGTIRSMIVKAPTVGSPKAEKIRKVKRLATGGLVMARAA
jgi:hypothetical protein